MVCRLDFRGLGSDVQRLQSSVLRQTVVAHGMACHRRSGDLKIQVICQILGANSNLPAIKATGSSSLFWSHFGSLALCLAGAVFDRQMSRGNSSVFTAKPLVIGEMPQKIQTSNQAAADTCKIWVNPKKIPVTLAHHGDRGLQIFAEATLTISPPAWPCLLAARPNSFSH